MAISESSTTAVLGIKVIDREGDARVCLRGHLSVDSSPDLRDRLLEILRRQSLRALTIDLAELTYMDCSGMATLVEALKIARARKAELLFRGLHDRARYLLEVTALLYVFQTSGRANVSPAAKAV